MTAALDPVRRSQTRPWMMNMQTRTLLTMVGGQDEMIWVETECRAGANAGRAEQSRAAATGRKTKATGREAGQQQ